MSKSKNKTAKQALQAVATTTGKSAAGTKARARAQVRTGATTKPGESAEAQRESTWRAFDEGRYGIRETAASAPFVDVLSTAVETLEPSAQKRVKKLARAAVRESKAAQETATPAAPPVGGPLTELATLSGPALWESRGAVLTAALASSSSPAGKYWAAAANGTPSSLSLSAFLASPVE
jgi:hypothetical protein